MGDIEAKIREIVREACDAGVTGISWIVQDEIENQEWGDVEST